MYDKFRVFLAFFPPARPFSSPTNKSVEAEILTSFFGVCKDSHVALIASRKHTLPFLSWRWRASADIWHSSEREVKWKPIMSHVRLAWKSHVAHKNFALFVTWDKVPSELLWTSTCCSLHRWGLGSVHKDHGGNEIWVASRKQTKKTSITAASDGCEACGVNLNKLLTLAMWRESLIQSYWLPHSDWPTSTNPTTAKTFFRNPLRLVVFKKLFFFDSIKANSLSINMAVWGEIYWAVWGAEEELIPRPSQMFWRERRSEKQINSIKIAFTLRSHWAPHS